MILYKQIIKGQRDQAKLLGTTLITLAFKKVDIFDLIGHNRYRAWIKIKIYYTLEENITKGDYYFNDFNCYCILY